MKKHQTNCAFMDYEELWKHIFPKHYREKYNHPSGLSGGGGGFPFYDIHLKQDVTLWPLAPFKLASSLEMFNVPPDWYLETRNKSTLTRMGIDASFNTIIDNGFKGYLTIEIVNNRLNIIRLKAGQPILKIIPQRVIFPCGIYNGKYQNQPDKPVGSILK